MRMLETLAGLTYGSVGRGSSVTSCRGGVAARERVPGGRGQRIAWTPRCFPRSSGRLYRLDRVPRARLVGEPGRVDLGVVGPFGWERFLGEDGDDRAPRIDGYAVVTLALGGDMRNGIALQQ